MEAEDIKFIIEQNDKQSKAIFEHIALSTQAVKAEVKASTDMLGLKVDGIIDRQDLANGRTKKLEGKVIVLERFRKTTMMVVSRWYLVLALFVLIGLGSAWSYHKINFKKTIENKTGIVIEEDH